MLRYAPPSSSLHIYTRQILMLSIVIVTLSASAFSSSNNHQFLSNSKLAPVSNAFAQNNNIQTFLHAAKDGNMMQESNSNTNSIITNTNNRNNESPSALSVSTAGNLPVRGGGMAQLSKIRDAIFPIYGKNEITKFVLLGTMKFFIIFVLTLTRDTKDTLIVTQCGAEAIAFLKVYGVLPAATAFIAGYAKMSSSLAKQTLFYATCLPFFVFFFLFDKLIYPNAGLIEPSLEAVHAVIGGASGAGGSAIVAKIFSHWTSALFFVVAEVYSSASIGILFWKFANDVVGVSQAKRFYPLFAYLSSFGPMIAGQYVVRYASKASNFSSSLHRLTTAISISGVMICALHHIVNKFVQKTEPEQVSTIVTSSANNKPKKKKATMKESIKFLASSQYLGLVSVLVVGYGLMYNFLEISWKSLVKAQYPNPLDYQRFMGNFSSLVGATTLMVIFLGSNIIKSLGWRIGAIATPAVMSMVAIPFFACTVFLGIDNPVILRTAVTVGTGMILLSRAFKYGCFDPTTQMSYIPLDEESKVKGKAAIDVLGSRVGKSGASLIQQGLVMAFGNIINASPVVMAIFYSVSFAWIGAANKLSKLYADLSEKTDADLRKNKLSTDQ